MKNIRVTIEYDGTKYAGWQWQPDEPTLQGALEEAIRKTSGESIRVTASGRTDAGVHAYGQIASFETEAGMEAMDWRGALNHFLPEDIRVLDATEESQDFSARHSARGKQYDYLILNRRMPSPLIRNRSWHIAVPLGMDVMRNASLHLMGKHDFTSFRAAGCGANHPIRELRRLDIAVEGELIRFSLEADAFLRHMVRNIVGTLVEVGRGRFTPDGVRAILEARDRTMSGPTAPPQGLYLMKVIY